MEHTPSNTISPTEKQHPADPSTKTVDSTFPAEERKWQEKMLPLISGMIIGLTVFFFLASLVQLFYLHMSIEKAPKQEITESFAGLVEGQEQFTFDNKLAIARFKSLMLLEANALARRHHQANVLLMSRVWTRYLGFVTGMILALVGAIFILGHLREPDSEISAKTQSGTVTFKSASPGIFLALLGVTLMLTTIVTHHEISVTDVPVYIADERLTGASSRAGEKPDLDMPKPFATPKPQ